MGIKPSIQPPTRKEQWVIRSLVLLGVLSILHFLYWFFQPEFRGHPVLYGMLCVVFCYAMLRHLYLWYHYSAIRVPKQPLETPGLSVDILTTYFPGEPREMVEQTLRAIQEIPHPHTTYLCDEANDPYLKNLCGQLGVRHVTRNNRKDAKAGNINNALRQATGEICLILDPDHVPQPDILDHILPHFADPDIGFVQIVQSYYNKKNSLVARGASEQTFQFYGPMMMSMNAYGTVNAIGANCTFRRSALDSIGGHAPGLAEDMHTAMQLHAKGWKSVYVPRVLARGLVPETLITHFKQQLKWSRGTFELLLRVYPGLFRNFTARQRLHYGLLPLHFLLGLIYLLGFCIPVASLLFSITPWTGNILQFLLAIFPVALSTLLIRAYIQKWVIEPDERGFHLLGGLLQIATWWIHFLGFVYAVVNKEVPYLPTKKKEAQVTNLRIVVPNILVGLISIFAILYGLSRDLTPFSLMMAGFAALNAFFMFFSLYLATGITNENRILSHRFPGLVRIIHNCFRARYRTLSNRLFTLTRKVALPALLLGVLLTAYALERYRYSLWEGIIPEARPPRKGPDYSGIFYPTKPDGKTDMGAVTKLEEGLQRHFDLVSFYLPWGDDPSHELPDTLLRKIHARGSWPLITWEPWMNSFPGADSIPEMRDNRGVFTKILDGDFDGYIDEVARILKSPEAPVFLRFAHEFDNPAYPWSQKGGNSPEDFVRAWRYVHDRFTDLGAYNIIWVWSPFTQDRLRAYFPGKAYVDWIGVTALNYGHLNQDGQWHSFRSLYQPFSDVLANSFPDLPVMLAEFGSLDLGGDREAWISQALTVDLRAFREIKAWVLFYSQWDQNLPEGQVYSGEYLDWTGSLTLPNSPGTTTWLRPTEPTETAKTREKDPYTALGMPKTSIRGVRYMKGQHWFRSHYILDRPTLEKDFKALKTAGVNTLRIEDPGVYTHNLLKISAEEDLQLIYSFHIPDTLDFLRDHKALGALHDHIVKTVEHHRNKPHIIAWNLGNPVWSQLGKWYARPALDAQRNGFYQWLNTLTSEIKKRDPKRRIFVDFSISQRYEEFAGRVAKGEIALDALGLIKTDSSDANRFRTYARKYKIPYYLADVRVTDLSDTKEPQVVVHAWQDQWEANHVTFDGLLDHRGHKKASYYDLAKLWADMPVKKRPLGSIAIQRPAIPLYAGEEVTYYAKRFEEGSWQDPDREQERNYEWFLVKLGYYGEPIALKALGKGRELTLTIPREYAHYELMLTYWEEDAGKPVLSIRKPLNLPLYSPN